MTTNKYSRLTGKGYATSLIHLNVHQALTRIFEIERLFIDVNQKYEGEYIFDRKYVAESVTNIIETLDRLIFNVNSLIAGQDIDFYFMLDELREKTALCLDTVTLTEIRRDAKKNSPGYSDELSLLLEQIMELTTSYTSPGSDDRPTEKVRIATAYDLVIICCRRIIDILQDTFGPQMAEDEKNHHANIVMLPSYYANKDSDGIEQTGAGSGLGPSSGFSAGALIDGLNEVLSSDKYPGLGGAEFARGANSGIMINSDMALTFYFKGWDCHYLAVANNCNYAARNYIYLMTSCGTPGNYSTLRVQLIRRLLNWLDLQSFVAGELTIGGVENVTASEINGHLNMLGKLMAYTSYPGILMEKESDIQKNLEIFLENVV